MKRIIKSSYDISSDILEAIADMMEDTAGRKLYAKICNVDTSALEGYLEGIADTLNAVGRDITGFDVLYNTMLEEGTTQFRKILVSSFTDDMTASQIDRFMKGKK